MRTRTTFGAAIAALALGVTVLAPATANGEVSAPESHGERHAQLNDGTQPGTQDVYFLDGQTLTNPNAETPEDAALFSVTGEPLNITWGEWSGARAHSLAISQPRTESTLVVVKLDGLVPDGVYSLFYMTLDPDSLNPDCSRALRDMPVKLIWGGTSRPDPSSFTADSRGRATLFGIADADLLAATQSSMQVIYHSDGNTYHPLPNRLSFETQGENCRSSFGHDAMRQIFILQKWIF